MTFYFSKGGTILKKLRNLRRQQFYHKHWNNLYFRVSGRIGTQPSLPQVQLFKIRLTKECFMISFNRRGGVRVNWRGRVESKTLLTHSLYFAVCQKQTIWHNLLQIQLIKKLLGPKKMNKVTKKFFFLLFSSQSAF